MFAYAANNPVKYTDPDGRELYKSNITKKQYDNSWSLQRTMSWEDVQKFFKDNPKGVLYRPDDQVFFMKLKNEKDIVDPNACNFDLVKILTGSKIISNLLKLGKFLKENGEVPSPSNHSVIQVTPDGIALPPGKKIPDSLVENPYRPGSYGIIENGKFKETLRIDPPTPPEKKGPNYSHFHVNDGKEHITDTSQWPE